MGTERGVLESELKLEGYGYGMMKRIVDTLFPVHSIRLFFKLLCSQSLKRPMTGRNK